MSTAATPPGPVARHEELLIAIRRITRAIDVHSRALLRQFNLSGPQFLVLRTVRQLGEPSSGEVAHAISLSQATLTGILSRLEAKGLIVRRRSEQDRRKVLVRTTEQAEKVLASAPRPLQDAFLERYEALPEWEQTQILSSLQHIVAMMDAQSLDVSPMLAAEPVEQAPPAPERAS